MAPPKCPKTMVLKSSQFFFLLLYLILLPILFHFIPFSCSYIMFIESNENIICNNVNCCCSPGQAIELWLVVAPSTTSHRLDRKEVIRAQKYKCFFVCSFVIHIATLYTGCLPRPFALNSFQRTQLLRFIRFIVFHSLTSPTARRCAAIVSYIERMYSIQSASSGFPNK